MSAATPKKSSGRPGSARRQSSASGLPPAPGGDLMAGYGLDQEPRAPEPTEEPAAPPPPSKGPVQVGRSLEITSTPDVCMEMMVDKLRLLDYEKEFCRRKKPVRKPLSRLYFAVEAPGGHSGEQFYYFAALAGWLLNLAGVNDFSPPKEGDDPIAACNGIIAALRKLGFAQAPFTATALRNGHGKEVCGVLDGLCDYVLERRNFSYRKPVYLPENDQGGELDDEGDAAPQGDGADEFPKPQYLDDDGDDGYMAEAQLGRLAPEAAGFAGGASGGAAAGPGPSALSPEKEMLVSKVDPTAWRLELERVAPRLRILLNADAKDWRSHLEEVQENSKAISTAWPESRSVLEKLRNDLNSNLEKLTTRERVLNDQFERLMQQYRAQRSQLQEIQEAHNHKKESVFDRNAELNRINEQLTEVQQIIDERGGSIQDATPVINMKKSIKKLSEELHDMEVRIGVVSHTLLQLSLKNRRLMHAQAAALSDEEDA